MVVQLNKARGAVVREDEGVIWKTATLDLMSDEEDAIFDGKAVWVVHPPTRTTELSALCSVLQKRLDMEAKHQTSRRRVSLEEFRGVK